MRLDKKGIEILLEKCDGYRAPKIELEQYTTPSHIAAELLWLARLKGDIEGKTLFDLGCGTGRLAIGCALLGASRVKGFDIDPDALSIARENAEKFDVDVEWIEADVREVKGECDTVVQNPPFGVRRAGADRVFLEKALELGEVVYSLHKAETREFIVNRASEMGRVTDIATVKFPLPRSYRFHRKDVKNIEVNIYRIEGKRRSEKGKG